MRIRLRLDPETGERRVLVDYESDEDALAVEHEAEHKRLAKAVLGEVEPARLRVSRGSPVVAASEDAEAEDEFERESLAESGK